MKKKEHTVVALIRNDARCIIVSFIARLLVKVAYLRVNTFCSSIYVLKRNLRRAEKNVSPLPILLFCLPERYARLHA